MSCTKGPLSPAQARATLAHRFTSKVDKLRTRLTSFGLRSKRVFLVWTHYSGEERGEGVETVHARVELWPTPKVAEYTALLRNPYSAGVYPEGSVRVSEISAGAYTTDMLRGLIIPSDAERGCCGCHSVSPVPGTPIDPGTGSGPGGNGLPVGELRTTKELDFFYEIVEDGRGDDPAARLRFRIYSEPSRNEGRFQFEVVLQRASHDMGRDGKPRLELGRQIGEDP